MHEDNGEEGDGQVGLTLSPLALPPTQHLPALPDPQEDAEVHVGEAQQRQHPCGQGGVPDQGQGVPANISICHQIYKK